MGWSIINWAFGRKKSYVVREQSFVEFLLLALLPLPQPSFQESHCEIISSLSLTNLTSVLGQCLDVIESRPELLRVHALPEPTAAAPRP